MKLRKFYMVEGEVPMPNAFGMSRPERMLQVIKHALTFEMKGFVSVEVKEVKVGPFRVHQIIKKQKEKDEKTKELPKEIDQGAPGQG